MHKGKGRFLDTEDLARRWKCHPETVRMRVRRGELKAIDPRPPFFFSMEEILKHKPPEMGRPKKVD